jgi:hypothetical protein
LDALKTIFHLGLDAHMITSVVLHPMVFLLPYRDGTFGIGIWLLQRLTKRRGDFLSVKSLSHAIPFGLEFSQVILHVLLLMKWGGFDLGFQFFHLLLKVVQFPCYHTDGHIDWILGRSS